MGRHPRSRVSRKSTRVEWGLVRERPGALIIGDELDSDLEWIDTARMEHFSIPVPADLRSTNMIVRLIKDGFLVFGPGPEVRRFDSAGLLVQPATPLPQWPVTYLVTSPNGRWLAWRDNNDEIALRKFWQIGSTNPPTAFSEPSPVWIMPTFAENNRLMAAIALGGEVAIWDFMAGALPEVETMEMSSSGI